MAASAALHKLHRRELMYHSSPVSRYMVRDMINRADKKQNLVTLFCEPFHHFFVCVVAQLDVSVFRRRW